MLLPALLILLLLNYEVQLVENNTVDLENKYFRSKCKKQLYSPSFIPINSIGVLYQFLPSIRLVQFTKQTESTYYGHP